MAQPTACEFKEEFPVFRLLSDELVQAKLDAAYRRTGADYWGELVDDAAKLLAAHLLALSPLGEPTTRDVNGTTGRTSYWDELEQLRKEVRPIGTVASSTPLPWPGW